MDRYPTFAHSGIAQPCQQDKGTCYEGGGRIIPVRAIDQDLALHEDCTIRIRSKLVVAFFSMCSDDVSISFPLINF